MRTEFLNILFNDAVNCCDFVVSVVDEKMDKEHWRNNVNRRKSKYSTKNLP
jgi:hypothetical protein